MPAEIVKNSSNTIFKLLNENNGCVAGCCTGFSIWTATEYLKFGAHDDQEGFFTIEETGWAKVGEQEIRLKPYICLIFFCLILFDFDNALLSMIESIGGLFLLVNGYYASNK